MGVDLRCPVCQALLCRDFVGERCNFMCPNHRCKTRVTIELNGRIAVDSRVAAVLSKS